MIEEYGAGPRDAGEMDGLLTSLEKLGRTRFMARLGRVPLTSGGRIERRDCYREISRVAADVSLLARELSGGEPVALGSCSIPFTEHELMDAVLLREEVRGLVRVLRSRGQWSLRDRRDNWAAVAKGAADLATHADRMGTAATSAREYADFGGAEDAG